jgi:hypothetical protein
LKYERISYVTRILLKFSIEKSYAVDLSHLICLKFVVNLFKKTNLKS